MGCNAHNHRPGCACGWGGAWHGPYGTGSYHSSWSDESYIKHFQLPDSHESFVNPNASCPVCGAAVFFYSSPEGGRVFFDELGPPWPKHPCTDNRAQVTRVSFMSKNQPQWQREGWQPLLLTTVERIDSSILKLIGSTVGSPLTIYVKYFRPSSAHNHDPTVRNTLAFVQKLDDLLRIALLVGFSVPKIGNAAYVSYKARELEPLA